MEKLIAQKMTEELSEYLVTKIIPGLEDLHNKNISYIDNYKKEYENWKKHLSSLSERSPVFMHTSNIYRQLEIKTNSHLAALQQQTIFDLYEDLEKRLLEMADTLDDNISVKQDSTLFVPDKENSLLLRIAKKLKYILFYISELTTRPLRKKGGRYYWNRKIPLRNLFTHYLIHNYLNMLLKNIEKYIDSSGQIFIKILNKQRNLDTLFINHHIKYLEEEPESNFEDAYPLFINKIDSAKSSLNDEFNALINNIKSEIDLQYEFFLKDYQVLGTIELPRRKYRLSKIKKELLSQKEKLNRSKKNYQNFIAAIFDRIEFHEDLLWFSSLLISSSQNLDKYFNSFISKTVNPILKSIIDETKDSILRIKSSTDLAATFKKEKVFLNNALDQNLIPGLLNKVSRNNAARVLNEYSKTLEKNLNEFEKEYTFVKPKSLNYRLKLDQLKKFSPKDIISPIVLQKLAASTKKIAVDFNNYVSKQNSSIIGLGTIIEYNLDSALIKLKEENSDNAAAADVATEGLSRAINKSEEYLEKLVSKIDEVVKGVDAEVSEVLNDLLAFSNIDRLITIKIQVSKEKAIQEAKATLQSYYFKISKWFIKAKARIISLFTESKEKIVGISSKVGLSSSQMELSEAMADYLVRVSESLNKLPYVYQRLFSNEQLNDERIFLGRENELAKLEKAINYWLNNHIASVMLIGEKGSGTSSLLNIVISKYGLEEKIYRKDFSGTIYSEQDLLSSFKKILQIENVSSVDSLIKEINSFKEKRIIIIENIEDFFLRIIGGFKAINLLLEIITATNSNILWITTCNLFAWQYLRKVLDINDYFTFNIHLTQLNEELLEQIIISRHNISGYDLEFVPQENVDKMKSYSKLTEPEKQEYLKKEYFEQLNKLSVNNIGVALFIWLRSIVEFDEERIKVNSNIELDYSFLNLLSDPKLFTLMAIILHDGLKLEEHALIFNNDIKVSQLLFSSLADDGIIFKRNDIYKINFQLYNPIIRILKDKNILH